MSVNSYSLSYVNCKKSILLKLFNCWLVLKIFQVFHFDGLLKQVIATSQVQREGTEEYLEKSS